MCGRHTLELAKRAVGLEGVSKAGCAIRADVVVLDTASTAQIWGKFRCGVNFDVVLMAADTLK